MKKTLISHSIREAALKLAKPEFVLEESKTDKNAIYVFGYGSLIYADGINHRGLKKKYKESDLQTATLQGYRREWNAVDKDGYTYLGLVKDKGSKVNGVLFQLDTDDHDIKSFERSEADGVLYDLVNVTEDVTPKEKGYKIYTDVTRSPKYEGDIDPKYLEMVNKGLAKRGSDFMKEFLGTTSVKAKGK